ncbi:hypothetical protein ASF28_21230 [Methylobacterium sp. Leaf99]|nr:hypothetical protein ASF28_21230 [Methylobacterium sp. Leaf99]
MLYGGLRNRSDPTMTARTKTARNEIRKIDAAYNNSVAVGLTIAGYWTPAVVFSLNSYGIVHKYNSGGLASLDPSETYTVIAVLCITVISLLSAQSFRHRAARNLFEMED